MKIYVPNYYNKFKCIADICAHTCCKGWEIDIDPDSMERYKTHPEVMKYIDGNSYILQGEQERCPFLREDLLCQQIIDHGEDFICNICKDHPRFRNFYDDRIEMGLGLCCEAACDLILDNDESFNLVPDKELSNAIQIMKVRSSDIIERLALITSIVLDEDETKNLYADMERLDEEWSVLLDKLDYSREKTGDIVAFIRREKVTFEQMAIYYLYRYPSIPSFAAQACYMVARCALYLGGDHEAIKQAARMYSSEVEYSDENMDIIYEMFEE